MIYVFGAYEFDTGRWAGVEDGCLADIQGHADTRSQTTEEVRRDRQPTAQKTETASRNDQDGIRRGGAIFHDRRGAHANPDV